MGKNKVLIYGDLTLNIIDGSSVWVVNLAKLISQNKNNQVDILLKMPIKNDILSRELEKISNINLITHTDIMKGSKMIDLNNINSIMGKLDKTKSYSAIIVRGKDAVVKLMESDLKSKIIPYLTDFCQNKDEITPKEKNELSLIYNSVNHMFVQTEEMKQYLKDILNVNGEKLTLLSPIVFAQPPVEKEAKTICYAGKLAKNWYIEELIEIMDKLYERDPEIKMYFIGNKFNNDLKEYKDKIISQLKASPNIEYIPQLPNEETRKTINKCELGYAFRSREIDNDDSLELSTKFLEYGFYEMPPVTRKTKMYTKILGDDYPLYVESVDEAVDKIYNYFENPENKITDLSLKFEKFNSQNVYNNVQGVLDNMKSEKSKFSIKNIKKFFKR